MSDGHQAQAYLNLKQLRRAFPQVVFPGTQIPGGRFLQSQYPDDNSAFQSLRLSRFYHLNHHPHIKFFWSKSRGEFWLFSGLFREKNKKQLRR